MYKLKSRIKNNKLLADSFVSVLGTVFGKGLNLVAGLYVANYLGKDIFGEYGIIKGTIFNFAIFSTLGLGYTATKFVAEYENSDTSKIKPFIKKSFLITLLFSLIISIVFFVFSENISKSLLNNEKLSNSLRLLSVIIVFNAITTTQVGVLAGLKKFKDITIVNIIIGIVTFATSIIFTFYWGFNGALISLLVVQILNCLLNQFYVYKRTKDYSSNDDNISYKTIISFSTPIALQEFSYAIFSWLTPVVLARTSGYGEVGMFSAANQWNAIVLFIPGILRNVILAYLSSSNNDKNGHAKVMKSGIKINFITTLIPCLTIFILADYLALIYSVSYKGISWMIRLCIITTLFNSITNVYAQAYTSIGKNNIMLLLRFFRDFCLIIFFYFLVKKINISGAIFLVICNIIFDAIFLFLMIFFYKKYKNEYI